MAGLAAFISVLIILFITLAFSVIMYLLQAFGIYKMGKNMGFPSAWLAFIPFANTYALGKVAGTYVKADGKVSAKFGTILLVLQILMAILLVAFFVLLIMLLVLDEGAIINNDISALVASSLMVPTVFTYLATIGLSVAYSVIYFVALWRIFALYNYKNATLYLVLSIFFSILYPIFLFVLRNKEPKFTIEQRMNIQQ